MSSDNGYVLRVHPNGGYALVGYQASSEFPAYATPKHKQYETRDDAIVDFSEHCQWGDTYYSEYGLSIGEDVREILRKEKYGE